MDSPSRGLVIAAFAAVYVIWGSTYLAIRLTLDTMPPFATASTRFLVAGAALYCLARLRGHAAPAWRELPGAALVGGLLLLGGNGGVMWGQQYVPSGLASVLIATVPIWVTILEAVLGKTGRPSLALVVGVAIGFLGVALLVGGGRDTAAGLDPLGAAALLSSAFLWSTGTVTSKRVLMPGSLLVATACQMLAGGALLGVVAAARGEWTKIDVSAFSGRSWLALAYLVVFGSLVAFSAYVWLLRVVAPTRVATYAYVNPVVALLLGWVVLSEPLHARTLVAAGLTIAGVCVIVTARGKAVAAPAPAPAAPAPCSAAPCTSTG